MKPLIAVVLFAGIAGAETLEQIAASIHGRVGACVVSDAREDCVRGDERFSLQSVMKMIAGLAALGAVDHQGWKLDDEVLVRKQDLSLYVQPLARLVTGDGYRATIGELIRRATVDSDSAAGDILIRRLGGPKEVQAFLERKGIKGVRIDRDERHLQTEIACLAWKDEYLDPATLEQAEAAVPENQRTACYSRYQKDARDTATPRGMAQLLAALGQGKLLSPASTAFMLDVMRATVTGPDRLKAGLQPGWIIGHKTGTSGTWNGITAATNDVGILESPDGMRVAVAVFVGDSRAEAAARAAVIARIASAAIARHQR